MKNKPVVLASVAVLLLLSYQTYARNAIWRDPVRLWQDTIEKSPQKQRPYHALSLAYFMRGQFEQSLDVDARGRELEQPDIEFWERSGISLMQLQRWDEAAVMLREAARRHPTSVVWQNLGSCWLQRWLKTPQPEQEWLRQAEDAYAASLWDDPRNGYSVDGWTDAQFFAGRSDAIRHYLLHVDRPLEPVEVYFLGKLAINEQDWPNAAALLTALHEHLNWPVLAFYEGYAFHQQGKFQQAVHFYGQALRRDPQLELAEVNRRLAASAQ